MAAVSASAFSLRRSSRSSSFTRFSAATSLLRVWGGTPSVVLLVASAPAAAARHSANCTSCTPSRRSNSPSASPARPWEATTTLSFSSGVQRRGLWGGAAGGGFGSGGVLMAIATLRERTSHFDSVG